MIMFKMFFVCVWTLGLMLFGSKEIFGAERIASNSSSGYATDDDNITLIPQKLSENEQDKVKGLEEKAEPPKIGNFALPTSQQPGALVGFGENIIDKGEVQLFLFADRYAGRHKVSTDLFPSVLVGVTDQCSLFFNAPYTPELKDGRERSCGAEDFFIQFEYAFYNKSTLTYTNQATLVANVTAPTGSARKAPPTGFGASSFFLGATYNKMWVDWFLFTQYGAVLTTSDRSTKFGNQFLYQFGFGRNMPSPEGWILAWIVEVDGQYNQKNRMKGHVDADSGGNFIFVTPSIWVSSQHFIFQFGVGFPIAENLFGKQYTFDYALNLNIGWSLY